MKPEEIKRLRETINELQRQLNERNEATKVWIQADTQTRAYCIQLEEKLERMRGALEEIIEKNTVVASYDPVHGEKLSDGEFAEIAREALREGK